MLGSGGLLLLLCQIVLREPCKNGGWHGTLIRGDVQHRPPWTWHPLPGKPMLRAGMGRGCSLVWGSAQNTDCIPQGMLCSETHPVPASAPMHGAAPSPVCWHQPAHICPMPLGGLYIYQTNKWSKALIEHPSGEPPWCRFSITSASYNCI